MKVSRVIALSLLIPLSGMAVLSVYLNAQENVPLPPQAGPVPPGATLVRELPGGKNFIREGLRIQYSPNVTDPKTLQLIADEQEADREARGLAASYSDAANDELRGNIKKKLKEKLSAIFELQQKRRAAEIASIEERLAKLKDVSKKREANKEAIVDRRLEQLTGGVDDLGWEESNRGIRYSTEAGGNVFEVMPRTGPGPSGIVIPVEPRTKETLPPTPR
jgi:hypothetical protein